MGQEPGVEAQASGGGKTGMKAIEIAEAAGDQFVTSWRAYLFGAKTRDTDAAILYGIGGSTPGITRGRIQRALVVGRIDDESYRVRIAACDRCEEHYRAGKAARAHHDWRDWIPLGNGAYARRRHGVQDEERA